MLKLIGKAQVEFAVNAFEELGIDKILLLFESFIVGVARMIAQAPEIIGIITIGSLETAAICLLSERRWSS